MEGDQRIASVEDGMRNIDTEAVQNDFIITMDDIESQNSFLSTRCCIFKIPQLLFRNNEKAYVPIAFSFGPLHHGNSQFTETEKIKLQYMQGLINRISDRNDVNRSAAAILKGLVKEIAGLEEAARQCYAVPVDFTRDEFIKILLVDGCFIIELFRRRHVDGSLASTDDPVLRRPYMRSNLLYDLFLLENQVPWMVLDRLFKDTSTPNEMSLIELVVGSFNHCENSVIHKRPFESYPDKLSYAFAGCKHLLDLFRICLICSRSTMPREAETVTEGKWKLFPSASRLAEAGVKFKKPDDSTPHNVLDIKFDIDKGELVIPTFHIREHTEAVLRNLIAFEQCYHECSFEITSYAMLMDNLISTTVDIDILDKNGIIQIISLNPEEAAQTFNKLYHDTRINQSCYVHACEQANEFCKRRWPKWRAMYVRNHFNSPWAIASQVFAAVIFILAFLQTLFTMKK